MYICVKKLIKHDQEAHFCKHVAIVMLHRCLVQCSEIPDKQLSWSANSEQKCTYIFQSKNYPENWLFSGKRATARNCSRWEYYLLSCL